MTININSLITQTSDVMSREESEHAYRHTIIQLEVVEGSVVVVSLGDDDVHSLEEFLS
jgi:hypothetical protein